ncbi:MAG: histidinol dehydrogenase, partial [Thiohalospira sp.]
MPEIQRLNTAEAGFDAALDRLLAWEEGADERVEGIVREILADVRARGDVAVVEHTNRLDRRDA